MLRLLSALLLVFGINAHLQAAIEPVYEGSNGIRNSVLTVCLQCHAASVTGAGRNGATSIVNFDTYAAAALWTDLLMTKAVTERSMPPAGYTPLNSEQRAALVAWQAAGFPEKAAATATTPQQSDCLFNWAEASFPDYFAPRTQSQSVPPYYGRLYPPGTVLAIAFNKLLYLGPLSAGAVLELGDVATFLSRAGCN